MLIGMKSRVPQKTCGLFYIEQNDLIIRKYGSRMMKIILRSFILS